MPEDEIMMPVPKPEAVVMAEIHALRQISDALTATNRSLATLTADVRDVRERVIKIEAKDMDAKIAEYRSECRTSCAELRADIKAANVRIDVLEAAKDRTAGAMSVGAWLTKYAPWLVALIMAGMAGVGVGVEKAGG